MPVGSVNLYGSGPDAQVDQSQILRAQQLAQLLQQQAAAPIDMPAPNAPMSITQGLAKLAEGLAARKQNQKVAGLQKDAVAKQQALIESLFPQQPMAATPLGDSLAPGGGVMANTNTPGAVRPSVTGDPRLDKTMASQPGGLPLYLEHLAKNREKAQEANNPGSLIGSASPSDFTPASLAKYQQSRNPADLVPIEKNMFGRFQPRDYTPESLNAFEQSHNPGDLRRVANYQPQQLPGGGIGGFNPVSGQVDTTPVTNTDAQRDAAALARAKAEASAIGETTGKARGALLTKGMNAGNIDSILDIAEPLIDEATGSGSGAIRDKLAAWFGESTSGAQATAQLLPLQAAIMLNQPRMEGPQSDKDVELYRQAAGQIGDPTVPRDTKKAAIKTIRRLQEQYVQSAAKAGANTAPSAAPAAPDGIDPKLWGHMTPEERKLWQ